MGTTPFYGGAARRWLHGTEFEAKGVKAGLSVTRPLRAALQARGLYHRMPRAVLLRHDLPDGSFHYDWMIQRAGGPDRPLATLRVRDRIDHANATEFPAERLADHRAAYLDYEGPVSGERGQVRRVAGGEMTIVEESGARLVVEGRLGSAQGRFEGSRLDTGEWRFRFWPQTQ